MENDIKHKVFSGALILSISNIIVKLLGVFFKVPLHQLLGDQGMSYFNNAYNIYVALYTIATTGIPIASVMLISESLKRNRKREVTRIFNISLVIFSAFGIVGTLIMILFANQLALLMGSPNSRYCIIFIAPTLLFVSLSSAFRGYFQGHNNMKQTGISEILEAIGKFAIGLFLARYAVLNGKGIEKAAAYGILGITIGVLLGMLFLSFSKLLFNKKNEISALEEDIECATRKEIVVNIVKIAIPVTLSSIALNSLSTIDSFTIINLLKGSLGQEKAEILYGNYSTLAVTLTHIPSAFISPISIALLPALRSCIASNEDNKKEKIESLIALSMKMVAILSIPSAIGMAVLSKPILQLMFSNQESIDMAYLLLSILSIYVIFAGIIHLTNAILNANKLQWKSLISMSIGIVSKILLNVILISLFGIYGAPISTVLSFVIISIVNMYLLNKYTKINISILKVFIKPLIITILNSVITLGSYLLFTHVLNMRNSISVIFSILITIIIYVISILKTNVISLDEIRQIPKGDKIARILQKLRIAKN